MKLMDLVRHTARVKHFLYRTEQAYVYWIERYIRFHGIRHPNTMGTQEVERYLTHLAVKGNVSASTQNQALAALLFLYQEVLKVDIGRLDAVRARRPKRVPLVLSVPEVRVLLAAIDRLATTERPNDHDIHPHDGKGSGVHPTILGVHDPGGVASISRWLSAAKPPVSVTREGFDAAGVAALGLRPLRGRGAL